MSASFYDTITPARWAEKLEYWSTNDTIVSRSEMAKALGLSPGRVSQLVGLGALDVVQLKPNPLFALEHGKACYRTYRQWLRTRKPGARYVNDEFSDNLEGDKE